MFTAIFFIASHQPGHHSYADDYYHRVAPGPVWFRHVESDAVSADHEGEGREYGGIVKTFISLFC